MKPILRRIATFLGLISPRSYCYPAVDIELAGHRYHLVGSIHMGTVDMSPLPDALLKQMDTATALVVEADISDSRSPFPPLEEAPPLSERLDANALTQLQQCCRSLALSYDSLDRLPAWQIALVLQAKQATSLGLRPQYGIDYQLINIARQRGLPIIELEGQQAQVELLQQLPRGGLPLLEDTLTHWHSNARLLQTMINGWLDYKTLCIDHLPDSFGNVMSEILMQQRNRRWRQQLTSLPEGNYVISVGALHLFGDDNLPALLRAHAF
ncbi:conjugal transfer protein TraB [Lonsdalea iberica]|uniref:Conjugal transfer protein TraB n=1 Tax=Lonsdalea iberica TaxID=1082703 RepID=A0A1X3RVX4_9GAMM|nr:TraB/GumN family protein [Lonsdalea iberica]OSN06170.1 conjugal transfer protein TraB [Lonsdalea iberica]OSN11813.1 conjugal transfer protein TraB [Lonsdalea iberica]